MPSYVDRALAELRKQRDPYVRLRQARELDEVLKVARIMVAKIKQDTVRALRTDTAGYGTISRQLGLSRGRIQQIATAAVHPLMMAAVYAFRDEHNEWHGEPSLLPDGAYEEAPSFNPFHPADAGNPFYGQMLTFRYGGVSEEHGITAYTVQLRLRDGSPRNFRMTEAMQVSLFGPPIIGSPERQAWDAARDRSAPREEGNRGRSAPVCPLCR